MGQLNQVTDYIHPVDVKVFVENNVPYLEYTGVIDRGEEKIKVHFPKIGLTLNVIEQIVDYQDYHDKWNCPIGQVCISYQIFVGNNDTAFTYEVVEREMTKAQIEKELGYKVKIVD